MDGENVEEYSADEEKGAERKWEEEGSKEKSGAE